MEVPSTFERLAQGSRARTRQIENFRSRERLNLRRDSVLVEKHSSRWSPGSALALSIAGVGLIILNACAPAAGRDLPTAVTPSPQVTEFTPSPTISPPLPTETPPTPTPALAEQAIKEGRLEITSETWGRYFIPVSEEEARRLLEEAKVRGEFKYILPFDPRNAPNLVIENVSVPHPADSTRNIVGIGFKNIPKGVVFYSPVDGEAKISRGSIGKDLYGGWSIKTDNLTYGFSFRRDRPEHVQDARIAYDRPESVTMGRPLLVVDTDATFTDLYPGYQVTGGITRNGSRIVTDGLMGDLLTQKTPSGEKIVFIGTTGK